MDAHLICIECDSTNISEEIIKDEELDYEYATHVCGKCGEKGVITRELMDVNDEKYYAALEKVNRVFVKDIIKEFSLKDYSPAYLENAFDLPQSTISKWQNGGFSHEGYVLLKIIQSFPWIVKVAEKKFSPESINEGSVQQTINFMQNLVKNPPAGSTDFKYQGKVPEKRNPDQQ